MRSTSLMLCLIAAAMPVVAVAQMPAIQAAVADPTRPPEDVARDKDRKPAEMLRFAGIKPGMTVVDMLPGTGYFTRLFADAVGPTGKVYAYVPDEMLRNAAATDRLNAIATGHPNIMPVHNPLMAPAPGPVADVVWTSQNYHDMKNMPGVDLVAFNKLVYAGLKPGGVYIVLDHVATPGSGGGDTKTLHRIDPATVKAEVLAAGFKFDGESTVLRNPADPHTTNVHEGPLRGHTDQFIYRFRKPKK